ncbi:MAG: SMP-30/gluconolactonase/LRE family protein [Bacteroidota bacterium]
MKTFPYLFVIATALLSSSCSKEIAPEENVSRSADLLKRTTISSTIQFTETNLFPEGVVYDPFSKRFYVSSVTRGDIGIVSAEGDYTPFITDALLTSTTGLEIDKARKRLYVANAPNGVGAYNIDSGERIFYTDLSGLIPGAPLFINDIALDPQGNLYVTNSFYPVIYKISPDGEASVFFNEPALALPAGQFGFNGIEYSNNGYLLVAYSSANSILKIPVRKPEDYTTVNLNATLNGPDGLLLSNNGKSLTIVNNASGGEGMVMTFTSKNQFESASLTSTFNTGSVFPTTATSDGKKIFVLYAFLQRLGTGQSVFTIQQVP